MKTKTSFRDSLLLGMLLITLATVFTYANSLNNGFVWDDYSVVAENNFIQSWGNLRHFTSGEYFRKAKEISYRPLVTLSYFLDFSLYGNSASGYHLTNLLLHITNGLLVYALIRLIARRGTLALITALLFSLHPVNSEAVNAVGFREDLLACLFFISALIFYIQSGRFSGLARRCFYAFSLLSFLLALLAKEISVTLPLVIVMYDYLFVIREGEGRLKSLLWPRYLGFVLVFIAYLVVYALLMKKSGLAMFPYPGGSFVSNLFTMMRVYAHYIYIIILPLRVHLMEGGGFISYSFSDKRVIMASALALAVFLLAAQISRRSKTAAFAMGWFTLTLLPVSNLVPLNNFIANRYLYLPIMGYCLLIAAWLSYLNRFAAKKVFYLLVVFILLGYSLLTMARNNVWRNGVSFWSEAVKNYPYSSNAHAWLSHSLRREGRFDEAINEHMIAVGLANEARKGNR